MTLKANYFAPSTADKALALRIDRLLAAAAQSAERLPAHLGIKFTISGARTAKTCEVETFHNDRVTVSAHDTALAQRVALEVTDAAEQIRNLLLGDSEPIHHLHAPFIFLTKSLAHPQAQIRIFMGEAQVRGYTQMDRLTSLCASARLMTARMARDLFPPHERLGSWVVTVSYNFRSSSVPPRPHDSDPAHQIHVPTHGPHDAIRLAVHQAAVFFHATHAVKPTAREKLTIAVHDITFTMDDPESTVAALQADFDTEP